MFLLSPKRTTHDEASKKGLLRGRAGHTAVPATGSRTARSFLLRCLIHGLLHLLRRCNHLCTPDDLRDGWGCVCVVGVISGKPIFAARKRESEGKP